MICHRTEYSKTRISKTRLLFPFKCLYANGAPLFQIVSDVKKRTKINSIRNGYGMTELTIISNVSGTTSNDDNVGPILPTFKCKVIDTKTGKTLGPRQIGELCYAGDQIMLGYFKNPETTAETIDKENWLHTGDVGYFNEEGCIYITGRIKELIKYKGFQVSPSEIETIILTHPSVKDVAVVGKPDERCGEIPMAFVVKQPNDTVSANEIVDFANGKLVFLLHLISNFILYVNVMEVNLQVVFI